MNRSKSTVIKSCVTGIDNRIKDVFNKDFFSFYEGIVEKVSIESGLVDVRIPDLDNTKYEDCRLLTLCNNSTSAILPTIKISTHVIVGFQAFSLGKPVILGQINEPSDTTNPFENDTLIFKNGNCSLRITEENITIANKFTTLNITPDVFKITYKDSVFEMTDSGVSVHTAGDITLGSTNDILLVSKKGTITANSEDITKDSVGLI